MNLFTGKTFRRNLCREYRKRMQAHGIMQRVHKIEALGEDLQQGEYISRENSLS